MKAAESVSYVRGRVCYSVNGEWQGKPFEIFDWQWKKIIAPLFGWLRADGTRRFKRAYISVPKKNGKSGLSALIQLYMLMADGSRVRIVIVLRMDRKQAGLVFGEAAKYVKASPELNKRLNVIPSTKRITYEARFSALTALSADKDSAEGIDAHCVVYDELHMAKSDAMYDILRFAGSARRQPLFVIIYYGWGFYSEYLLQGVLVREEVSWMGIRLTRLILGVCLRRVRMMIQVIPRRGLRLILLLV